MKTRMGFVSNSSSSSFIIASKEKPKMIIEIDIEYIADKKITTEKELVEYLLEEYGYDTIEEFFDNEEWDKNNYDKCLKALEEGNFLYAGSISSDGETSEAYIYDNGWNGNKNFEVLKYY